MNLVSGIEGFLEGKEWCLPQGYEPRALPLRQSAFEWEQCAHLILYRAYCGCGARVGPVIFHHVVGVKNSSLDFPFFHIHLFFA